MGKTKKLTDEEIADLEEVAPWAVFPAVRALIDEVRASRAAPSVPRGIAEALPDDLRSQGWAVAIHNDYRQGGESRTFWLFTHPSGKWLKGEGPSDADALAQVRAALRLLGGADGKEGS